MVQPEIESPATEVGPRLRELRIERDLSLRELARLSGISANALSQIERGLTSPSVSTLYRLVEGLKVPITAVFQAEPRRENVVFRKVDQRARASFPFGLWEGLGGDAFVGKVEPFNLTLNPAADSGAEAIVHTGNEFVICLEGHLGYTVEDQSFELFAGDSLLFAARLRHRWRNLGDEPARMVVVLSGFESYESPMGFHFPE